MNMHTLTTTRPALSRAAAREREKLRAYAQDCNRAARLFERTARQARKKFRTAQEELADLEQRDDEVARLFDRGS